jgi:hypothetical protein
MAIKQNDLIPLIGSLSFNVNLTDIGIFYYFITNSPIPNRYIRTWNGG